MSATDLITDTYHESLVHILRSLENAEVSNWPFPHFYVRNLLPQAIYDELLDSFPDVSHYSQIDKYNQGAAATRHRFGLLRDRLEPLGTRKQSLWLGVRNALGALEVKRAVFQKLRAGIAYRFQVPEEQAADVPGYPLPELYRETSGYSIKPHPDTRKKVVTMQIAMPRDDSQEELGTAFYRLSVKPTAFLSNFKGFEKVKQVPFLPNSGYAFVVLNTLTKRSWHGREELSGASGVRNSLLHLYFADPQQANPELVEQFYRQAA